MVYVIMGETASGKTDAALKICRETGMPFISADAFAVYQGFDIGSAKPSKEELAGIENYFISSVKFGDEMTVYRFQKEGRLLLDRFAREKRDCVIAGGTFLYVRALLFPYEFPDYDLDPEIDSMPFERAVQELLSRDPLAATSVDLHNPIRVRRALAMARAGKTRTETVNEFVNKPLYPSVFLTIQDAKEKIDERIRLRASLMLKGGLVAEAERLMAEDPAFASKFKGIGFKEAYTRLSQGAALDGLEEEIALDTIKYAKRQRTFLRHQFPFKVSYPREKIPELIVADFKARKEKGMAEEKFADLIPLFPNLTREYLPDIDAMYNQGVRCIGIYTRDKGLLDDFAYWVHLRSPLMQILYFDDKSFKDKKLPPFSFVMPLCEDMREAEELTAFIQEKGISREVPQGLNLVRNKG